jgi:hypothetical protein
MRSEERSREPIIVVPGRFLREYLAVQLDGTFVSACQEFGAGLLSQIEV